MLGENFASNTSRRSKNYWYIAWIFKRTHKCLWTWLQRTLLYGLCYSAPVRQQSIVINPSVCLSVWVCVCLSASISLEPPDRSSGNFVCRSPVAVVRSSSGGLAILYVLPVLWMTSRLAVMGGIIWRWDKIGHRDESDVYECQVEHVDHHKQVSKQSTAAATQI